MTVYTLLQALAALESRLREEGRLKRQAMKQVLNLKEQAALALPHPSRLTPSPPAQAVKVSFVILDFDQLMRAIAFPFPLSACQFCMVGQD